MSADGESLLNECFTVAWDIATSQNDSGEIDHAFWAHVRLLAEQCRTDDDWQSLLGVLLQISLSEQPPPLDREPIYRWTVGRAPSLGLRASRPKRGQLDSAPTMERAARNTHVKGDRKAKRARLREVLDGAPEENPGEQAALARWVLDDAEFLDSRRGAERELLADEMMFAMRKIIKAAQACKREADTLRANAMKASGEEAVNVDEEEVAEDVLRAGNEGTTQAGTAALATGEGSGEGGGGEGEGGGEGGEAGGGGKAGAGGGGGKAAGKAETRVAQQKRLEDAAEAKDLDSAMRSPQVKPRGSVHSGGARNHRLVRA